jgi:hypothetical protein
VVTSRVAGTPTQRDYTRPPRIDATHGWYFYGITTVGSLAATLLREGERRLPGDAVPLQLLVHSGIAAVVRPVLLDDFAPAAMNDRMKDDTLLEDMVRRHNDVVEAIHARQAILPSQFGVVYTSADDVVSALCAAHDTLLQQLHRLQGCDEWAVHLYADEPVVRQRVSETSPIRELREAMAVARPGRAYFLEQQLRDALRDATEREFSARAHIVFDRLASYAVDGFVSPVSSSVHLPDEVEILRASFLIARDVVESFKSELHRISDNGDGVRCELTGPWPLYSFVAQSQEER